MARMTAEQRREQREAENRTKRIAEFKERIATERAKRVYSDRAAFDDAGANEHNRKVSMALYELVYEHRRITDDLRTLTKRMAERMAEAERRMDAGDRAFWSSTALGDLPADIEQASAKRDALADAVARLAWATGWYVPQVMRARDNEARNLLISLDVVPSADRYVVRSTQHGGTLFYLSAHDGVPALVVAADTVAAPTFYDTEEAAWLAAMHLCGEHV